MSAEDGAFHIWQYSIIETVDAGKDRFLVLNPGNQVGAEFVFDRTGLVAALFESAKGAQLSLDIHARETGQVAICFFCAENDKQFFLSGLETCIPSLPLRAVRKGV